MSKFVEAGSEKVGLSNPVDRLPTDDSLKSLHRFFILGVLRANRAGCHCVVDGLRVEILQSESANAFS